MKKIALIGLISLLSACTSQKIEKVNINEEYLLGNWVCVTSYNAKAKAIYNEIVENISFNKDKTFKNKGSVTMISILKNEIYTEGKWNLENNYLTYYQNDDRKKVTPYFSSSKFDHVYKKDPKFIHLKNLEESLLKQLKNDYSADNIKLLITKASNNNFYYEQHIKNKVGYGYCIKEEKTK